MRCRSDAVDISVPRCSLGGRKDDERIFDELNTSDTSPPSGVSCGAFKICFVGNGNNDCNDDDEEGDFNESPYDMGKEGGVNDGVNDDGVNDDDDDGEMQRSLQISL
jgi:hypothetical protein